MYRASNANLTMYGDCWQLRLLAMFSQILGIQFHVDGLPFGAKFDRKRYEAFHGELETAESGQ